MARDINGVLSFEVLLRVLDLYGETHGWDAWERLELFRKATFVESIAATERQRSKALGASTAPRPSVAKPHHSGTRSLIGTRRGKGVRRR